jgi:methylmalonyl-CoA mutase N-terminal domain/subunit
MHEAGTTDTADPLGGGYYIEALTAELERQARELIERVDELGGAVAAVEAGFVQGEIEESAYRFQMGVEAGTRIVVGVNEFTQKSETDVVLHRVDPAGERRQRDRTARVRSERNADTAAAALAAVRETAAGSDNLLPSMREALRARCTIGEICGALRELWGTYDGR